MVRKKFSFVVLLLIALVAGCRKPDLAKKRAESIQQGDAFMAKKDYEQAIAAYRTATNGGTDGAVMMKLTDAYLGAQKLQEAFSTAMRAADLLPDNLDAQLVAANFLLRGERMEEVTTRVSGLLAKYPDNVDLYIIQGNAAAGLRTSGVALTRLGGYRGPDEALLRHNLRPNATPGRDRDAEEYFREAIARQTDPGAVKAQEALINFLWAAGRFDETEPMLKEIADSHPEDQIANQALADFYLMRHREVESEYYLRRAAAVVDGGAGARRRLFNLYWVANRKDEAMAVLTSMLQTDDADGSVSLRVAITDFEAGKLDEALRRVDPLLARKPPVVGARVLKAQVLIAKGGEQDQVLALAREAVAAESNSSEAHAALGLGLAATGDLEGAYDAQVEALGLDATAADSLLELSRLSIALGRTSRDAEDRAREAVRLKPNDRHATLTLVKALIYAKRYDEADEVLKGLLPTDQAASDVLAQVGALAAARRDANGARAAFTRALQTPPDSLEALSGLVSLDLSERRTAAALKLAEDALAKHPRDPGYLAVAARVYTASGDTPRAESTLRQVLERDPGNLDAAMTLARSLAPLQPAEARRVLEQLLVRRPRAELAHRLLETLPSGAAAQAAK